MDEKYLKLMKRQNAILTAILSVLVGMIIIVVVAGFIYLPKIDKMITEVEQVAIEISDLTKEVEESNLTDTIDSFNAIDIESLNDAIKDLKKVVEPLAKIFGK